jgi:hypothetical protein
MKEDQSISRDNALMALSLSETLHLAQAMKLSK